MIPARPLETTSISTRTWMQDMDVLKDRPLRELVIPGSHDAGTFVMEHKDRQQFQQVPGDLHRSVRSKGNSTSTAGFDLSLQPRRQGGEVEMGQ